MKTLTALVTTYLNSRRQRGNLQMLLVLLGVLAAIVVLYSVAFHWIMAREGQQHSWITGFYWTMVSMSTLGYGDISFTSDLGRLFSVLVLSSGTVFMLILLPFTFIQFFYAPWLEARDAARAPRELPPSTSGHVLLTGYSAIDVALIHRLEQFGTPYCVIVPEAADALALYDKGVRVMVGPHDDPETYRRARADRAALIVAVLNDTANANIAMTAREAAAKVPIVATAKDSASADVLELAGCNLVLQLDDLLGRTMARRVFARTGRSHFVGEVGRLRIAEAAAVGTPLVGHTLRDLRLRERFNVTVGGVWERGRFTLGGPETIVAADTVLLLAGTGEQLDAYDQEFGRDVDIEAFAVIVGGGRVGRAVARALREQNIDYRIIEKVAARVAGDDRGIVGDASDLEVLKQAGIERASAVIVTTHEDDMNVYLTLYCRKLRPDVLILSRATLERNSVTLHRAGADFVLSYSAMGANAVANRLRDSSLLLLAEGLDVATVPTPPALVGRTLAQSRIRVATGCNVLAIRHADGTVTINPQADMPIPADSELVILGDREAERKFFEKYRS